MRGGAPDLSNHRNTACLVTFTDRVRLFRVYYWACASTGTPIHTSPNKIPKDWTTTYWHTHTHHFTSWMKIMNTNFRCNTNSSVTSCSSSHASLCVSWLLPVLLQVQMRSSYLSKRVSYSLWTFRQGNCNSRIVNSFSSSGHLLTY